jgi:hypothetical protein
VADEGGPGPPPSPQWRVIERITFADVLGAESDNATAESIPLESLDLGRRHRLPRQIQRAIRIARRAHHPELAEHADIILAHL